MRTDAGRPTGEGRNLHFHDGSTCHGHPTLAECEEQAVANAWIGKVLERADVYPDGSEVRCYSLVTLHFDHWSKHGRYVAETKVVSVAIVGDPTPRFVRLFRYDPAKDPTARTRVDYDPDFGNAILSDENVHAEQADNPDARHKEVLASFQLTLPMVRWLAVTMAELVPIMEENQRRDQEEVDRLIRERELNKT